MEGDMKAIYINDGEGGSDEKLRALRLRTDLHNHGVIKLKKIVMFGRPAVQFLLQSYTGHLYFCRSIRDRSADIFFPTENDTEEE